VRAARSAAPRSSHAGSHAHRQTLDARHAGAPPGRLDHDALLFDGQAGETITVMLERDGAGGSTGEIAELILGEERGPELDADTGALPLELTVTLPAAGSCCAARPAGCELAPRSGSPP
jgi:hypothetical protein